MSLPIYTSQSDPTLMTMETNWAAMLNPVISSPIATPTLLKNISLSAGKNTINHTLGSTLQGWIIVQQHSQASIWDNQNTNPLPAQTLILMATSAVTINLLVF